MSYHEWLGPLLGSSLFPLGPSFFPKFMFVFSKFFPKGKKNLSGKVKDHCTTRFRLSCFLCFLFFFPGLFFFFFFFFGKILVYELCLTVPTYLPCLYRTVLAPLRVQYFTDCLLYLNNNMVSPKRSRVPYGTLNILQVEVR